MGLYLSKRGVSKPEYPEKTPDNQPENQYHIMIRGENSPPRPGIEPPPSPNSGDKFAWSERAGSTPPNYWAGMHDNVPDRPSAKVAPAGCQLATMAITIKTVAIPKGGLGCTAEVRDVSASGLS